ncbi:MAG: CDP-diacylglycerol--serine O-phosphatidyltransferase [Alistipes sp.]|nr:CDP-diacylglycerol--serine O-phosphatidyltransferase [Alistipes sp.]
MKIRLFTLPNILTLANLMAGVLAIVATLNYHDYETALWLIVAAAIFDFFDGFVARLLHQQSPLGVQLDSLADDVTFGVAPALVMFDLYRGAEARWVDNEVVMQWLGLVVLLIAAFSVLRLAKFNIDTTQSTEFEGLPTPANALLIISLALLAEQGHLLLYKEIILAVALLSCYLLISPIRMFALKFKGFGIKDNALRYGFILVALVVIICFTTYSIPTIIVLYIVVSLLRWLTTRSKA